MTKTNNRFPPLYLLACTLLVAGLLGIGTIFSLSIPQDNFRGLLYICLALILFGSGELLNHPRKKVISPESVVQDEQEPQYKRKRNPCGLGTLLGIGALLLFFIGLSSLLFQN